ncbi:MAG: tripartite tricarboxylate transporter TctB family protein [Burkholderiaceae bacterium]
MVIRQKKDFWSGVMFVALGILFIIWSREYQFGNSQRMGPGYFPTILGYLMTLLGILVAIPAFSAKSPVVAVDRVGWRGLLIVLGAVLLYALLLLRLGFVVSLVVLVVLSAIASDEFSWKETLISVIVLGVLSYIVFVKGLELQFPVWPTFLSSN